MRNYLAVFVLLSSTLSPLVRGQGQPTTVREITGLVRLGTQPAPAGVSVMLEIVSGRYATPSNRAVVERTVTDGKGRFAFEHLENAGQNGGQEFFAVTAQSPGYASAFQVVDLTLTPRGEATLVLQKDVPQREGAGTGASTSTRRPSNREAQEAWDRAQDLLFRKHDPKASINELKTAVKSDPWFAPGYFLLGLAYMQTQQWNQAQLAFTEASKVEPGNAQAYLGLGSALNEQGNFPGAQKALEHSLELNPDSAEAHYELARTFVEMGVLEKAQPHASRAIEINPDYSGPHALMGKIYLQQQNPQFALAEFREYLRLDPEGSLAEDIRQVIPALEKASAEQAEKKRP
jgi:cytochrome c-type biogenesis protein CcmH/NrfG